MAKIFHLTDIYGGRVHIKAIFAPTQLSYLTCLRLLPLHVCCIVYSVLVGGLNAITAVLMIDFIYSYLTIQFF